MAQEFQDTAFHVVQVLRGAEAIHGVPFSEMVERAGVPPSLLMEPLSPLPVAAGARLIDSAVSLTQDPLLGLRTGVQTYLRRDLGVAGLFVTHAPDLRAALELSLKMLERTSTSSRVASRVTARGWPCGRGGASPTVPMPRR